MKRSYKDLNIGDIFPSKFNGDFKILKIHTPDDIDVEFITTGYQLTTSAQAIFKGCVKDKYFPRVSGKGYIGYGKYKSTVDNKSTRPYSVWKHILKYCYEKAPKVIEVNPQWLNFQNFAEWYVNQPIPYTRNQVLNVCSEMFEVQNELPN